MADEKAKSSDKKETEGEESTPEVLAAKKKKKMMVFAILGVVVIAVIGAVVFMMNSGKGGEKGNDAGGHGASVVAEGGQGGTHGGGEKKDSAKKEEKSGHGKSEEAGKKAEENSDLDSSSGSVLALKPFHLNLGNPLENRYISLEISLEYKNGEQFIEQELKSKDAQIRDAIIGIVTNKTMEFLISSEGKQQLRREVFKAVNGFLKNPIQNVYITNILIE